MNKKNWMKVSVIDISAKEKVEAMKVISTLSETFVCTVYGDYTPLK